MRQNHQTCDGLSLICFPAAPVGPGSEWEAPRMCPRAPSKDLFTVNKHWGFLVGGAFLEAQALAQWLLLVTYFALVVWFIWYQESTVKCWGWKKTKKASFSKVNHQVAAQWRLGVMKYEKQINTSLFIWWFSFPTTKQRMLSWDGLRFYSETALSFALWQLPSGSKVMTLVYLPKCFPAYQA